jgi:pimeloyl-ACP methyl ester carboxylesterase
VTDVESSLRFEPAAYLERGQGPPLILIPGLDGTALLFYRQVPLLAARFRVLTFPLPDDATATMDSLVEDLKLLLRGIDPAGEGAFLCGESFGGALGLSFALAHAELLRGLIVVNSFPVIRQRLRLRLAPLLLKTLPWGTMGLVRRFTGRRLHSPHTRPEDLAEFNQRIAVVRRTGYIRRLEILQTYDIRRRLAEIATPTLLLAGDRDRLVPSVREANFMAARMPRATVSVLEGYGHICMINHDLSLLDYMLPWLETLPAIR